MFKLTGCILLMGMIAIPAMGQDAVREYNCARVPGEPPVIDGEWSEEEWAGSQWTGEFYGLRNGAVAAQFQGQPVDLNYRWRALWDDEYLYVLVESEVYFLSPNGIVWPDTIVNELAGDDAGYAGFAVGQNVDLELFIEPNWQEGDGYNSNPPDYTEATNGVGEPAYQFVYFPLVNDEDFTPSNFGIRNSEEGPPFMFTGVPGQMGGDWSPVFDPAFAESEGVMPMVFGAQPHEIEGTTPGEEIVARPAMEIAFPFSQFTLAALLGVGDVSEIAPEAINTVLEQDADGNWVNPGDEWLINVTAYTDGALVANGGPSLITWNNVVGGGFRTYPRGILRFVEGGTDVGEWMTY